MGQRFFKIHSRSIFNPEWGDYDDMLQNGMSMHRPRVNGRIALERTGPFIPQVTIPFEILLTSEAKIKLESSGLSGFEFIPVEKAHIVEMPWETWDLQAEQPAEYPESGEPEDYILNRPHDPALATFMGDIWELASTSRIRILRPEIAVDTSTWNGDDVFRGEGFGLLLFSDQAREWFSEK